MSSTDPGVPTYRNVVIRAPDDFTWTPVGVAARQYRCWLFHAGYSWSRAYRPLAPRIGVTGDKFLSVGDRAAGRPVDASHRKPSLPRGVGGPYCSIAYPLLRDGTLRAATPGAA